MSNLNPSAEPTVSNLFCAPNSDLTCESCDKVLFKVHRKNLECASEGFAPPDGTVSSDEPVPLSESAEVLELLFQYMYPRRVPDLKVVEFRVVADVAEAAEKYQVFAAMGFCKLYMEAAYPYHPFEVLIYATKHGYPDLMDLSEKRAMQLSPAEAFGCFSPAVYIAWTRFYAQWLDILKYARGFEGSNSNHDSSYHGRQILQILRRLDSPASLVNLDFAFEPIDRKPEGCGYANCVSGISRWRSDVEAKIAALSSFSTFL